jgi:nucleoside-diphosphate-sugar epimerase
LPVWTTALNQYRPYLSIKDAIKSINFVIKKNIFDNQIYNVLTNNYTVQEVLNSIKKNKYKFKIKKTFSKIMNQYSYNVSKEKFENLGIRLKSSLDQDIKNTFRLFTNINKSN